ncbi:MAG TPA: hypothetical protein VOA64_04910, partial [Candidatus Dormibacteraeota bacterium]|nr:hypothetical protein [Candidatus Dormibacteraeota bacterium]
MERQLDSYAEGYVRPKASECRCVSAERDRGRHPHEALCETAPSADGYRGGVSPVPGTLSPEPRFLKLVCKLKNSLKYDLLRLFYRFAYHLAAPAVYSRQPFVRYPYMYLPSEIMELTRQLLSVQVPGAAVEVGCHQGWTTCFLVEAL